MKLAAFLSAQALRRRSARRRACGSVRLSFRDIDERSTRPANALARPLAPPGAADRDGLDAAGLDSFAAAPGPRFLNLRKTTIYAGSNEIRHNIIAKTIPGL